MDVDENHPKLSNMLVIVTFLLCTKLWRNIFCLLVQQTPNSFYPTHTLRDVWSKFCEYSYSFNASQTELGRDYQNAMINFMVINFILPSYATHIDIISMSKMQHWSNSNANALELLHSYANPSICCGMNIIVVCDN